jgi:hypothetical protein
VGTVEGMPTSAQQAMSSGKENDRGGELFHATEKNVGELGHLRRWIAHRERGRRTAIDHFTTMNDGSQRRRHVHHAFTEEDFA